MKIYWLLYFFIIVFFVRAEAKEFEVCEGIVFNEGPVQLNGNEKVLVCGIETGPNAWQEIPVTQKEMHLRSILQNSGYLNPTFKREPNRLVVSRGSQSIIKSFQISGADQILDPEKKRKVIDETLTPGKLNEIEHWANQKVRAEGYPCPRLDLQAHGWNGEVLLDAEVGNKQNYGTYSTIGLNGLNEDILKRYQPFNPDETYDIRKTQIMSERLLGDGLFQSAFFETSCSTTPFHLELKTMIGSPKILRFGFGASTEELPFADLTFRNARLDNQASSFTVNLHGSPIKQSLDVDSEFYWLPGWHRTYVAPRTQLSREIESAYQTDTSRTGIDVGIKWDKWDTRFLGRAGPSLNTVETTRGTGPTMTYSTIDGSLTMNSHEYESSMANQEKGWTASFFLRTQKKGIGSNIDLSRYEFNTKFLWNIGGFSPPFLVLGTRLQGISVQTADESALDEIPIEDRVFAGGDQNLRGFARKSINNFGLGYLNFIYSGFELRLIEELPYHIQPFLLWDLAKVGTRGSRFDPALFVSEGIGARWRSPFGTFRGSYARGRIFEPPANVGSDVKWVFFLSFGQEF
jgi:translocation and assembly module TamA